MNRTILIMAAGTGGHIFPGLAIARELVSRGWKVHWMGTPSGMENKLVAEAGYPMTTVNITGVRGKGAVAWLFLPLKILRAPGRPRARSSRSAPTWSCRWAATWRSPAA